MTGYSGTPLPKKLGIKPGFRVCLVNNPSEVGTELSEALATCDLAHDLRSQLDFALVFTKSRADLGDGLPSNRRLK